jgi:hypothetical protein
MKSGKFYSMDWRRKPYHKVCPRLTTLIATIPWLRDIRVLVEAA